MKNQSFVFDDDTSIVIRELNRDIVPDSPKEHSILELYKNLSVVVDSLVYIGDSVAAETLVMNAMASPEFEVYTNRIERKMKESGVEIIIDKVFAKLRVLGFAETDKLNISILPIWAEMMCEAGDSTVDAFRFLTFQKPITRTPE